MAKPRLPPGMQRPLPVRHREGVQGLLVLLTIFVQGISGFQSVAFQLSSFNEDQMALGCRAAGF